MDTIVRKRERMNNTIFFDICCIAMVLSLLMIVSLLIMRQQDKYEMACIEALLDSARKRYGEGKNADS